MNSRSPGVAAGRAILPGRAFAGLVLAGLVLAALVLAGTAGCSVSAADSARAGHDGTPHGPVAEVTGFTSNGFFASFGRVTARIAGPAANRLAQLVNQLPSGAQPDCHESPWLIYRIAFSAGSVGQSTAVVDGYRCGAVVSLTTAGKVTAWRQDAACELYLAVRQLLPGRARATRDDAPGCSTRPLGTGQ